MNKIENCCVSQLEQEKMNCNCECTRNDKGQCVCDCNDDCCDSSYC